jgi:acyl-CoA thioesterase
LEPVSAPAGATMFDRATAVAPLGEGAWSARVHPGWATPHGPNGGYLAAIVLRAMQEELADHERPARTITLHYLRPPAEDELRIEVAVERSGRNLSTLSARALQDGRLCILAIGAFSRRFASAADWPARPPSVPPPEDVALALRDSQAPSISQRFDVRPALGPAPFSGGDEARTGGWLRLREPRQLDAVALAMYVDAWLPAPFMRLTRPVGAPTVDLTIHFRNPDAVAAVPPEEPVLVDFRSTASAEGFFEEDGEIRSRAGVLLAQSRQLALLAP